MATTSTTTTAIPKKVGRRDMKAFLRYDGSGRVVPSSVILRKKSPKVGNWAEIDAYRCCEPSLLINIPNPICVTGFVQNIEFNGEYTYLNRVGGKPHYQKGGAYDIYWENSNPLNVPYWTIGDVAMSQDNVADPTLVSTVWVALPGNGTIVVTSGPCGR